jgi:hypothetical protein
MASHREYYKGEGGGFFQIQVVVSLSLLVACARNKNAPIMHN